MYFIIKKHKYNKIKQKNKDMKNIKNKQQFLHCSKKDENIFKNTSDISRVF